MQPWRLHRKPKTLWRLGAISFALIGLVSIACSAYVEFVESPIEAASQTVNAGTFAREIAKKEQGIKTVGKLRVGQIFGVLYAARLGENFKRPIGEGTSVEKVLNPIGVGHYSDSQLPGEVGNFALAAHRTTHGGAFNYIDSLKKGDVLFVETSAGWYQYKVIASKVVEPSERWVIGADPLGLGQGKYLTLTTCTPRYTALQRLVVWGEQTAFFDRAGGAPSELKKFF